MELSRELLLTKRKHAIEERDRFLGAANAQVGRIAALDDLIAIFDLPAPPPPPSPPPAPPAHES